MGIDNRLFDIIVSSNRKAPFYRLTGITTKTLGPGWAQMAVQTNDDHGNPLGLIHGGLISTLADAAMGNAIRSTGRKAVTINYDISFLSAAPAGKLLIGRGRVDRAGSRIVYTSVEVTCEDQVIATSQAAFYVVGEIELD